MFDKKEKRKESQLENYLLSKLQINGHNSFCDDVGSQISDTSGDG
jgi:hypothetical protein